MKDRLQQLLDAYGLTPTRLAEITGVQRSSISHVLSGRNNPGYDFIEKLLTSYPDLSADWLLLGKGSMSKQVQEPSLFPDIADTSVPQQSGVTDGTTKSATSVDQIQTKVKVEDDNQSTNVPEPLTGKRTLVKVIACYNDGTFEAFDKL